MATRTKTNGRANGSRRGFDPSLVAAQTDQLTAAAHAIARITDEVSEGADTQVRSLDATLSGLNEMAASLKETAGQADVRGGLRRGAAVVGQRDGGVDRAGHGQHGQGRRLHRRDQRVDPGDERLAADR